MNGKSDKGSVLGEGPNYAVVPRQGTGTGKGIEQTRNCNPV